MNQHNTGYKMLKKQILFFVKEQNKINQNKLKASVCAVNNCVKCVFNVICVMLCSNEHILIQ